MARTPRAMWASLNRLSVLASRNPETQRELRVAPLPEPVPVLGRVDRRARPGAGSSRAFQDTPLYAAG